MRPYNKINVLLKKSQNYAGLKSLDIYPFVELNLKKLLCKKHIQLFYFFYNFIFISYLLFYYFVRRIEKQTTFLS